MGHTLVTRFDAEGYQCIRSLLDGAGIHDNNKIPFGRDCDRGAANTVLPYHVTVAHWGRKQDEVYLKRLEDFRFQPCRLQVTGAGILEAEEYSRLLYLSVEPDRGWYEMQRKLSAALGMPPQGFLHMTLSVSRDRNLIMEQWKSVRNLKPFLLNVTGLDLYHIWTPVKRIRSIVWE